jgi:signal transduction histidine kinase
MQEIFPSTDVIAAELAALRTAAGLVARGASPRVVLESVARHVAVAVEADFLEILQFDEHDRPRVIAAWASRGDRVLALERWALDDDRAARRIATTRAPTREDAGDGGPDATSENAGERHGIRSSVGVPVLLQDRVWGAIFVHSIGDQPLPDQTEARLLGLSQLIASAVANSHANTAVEELAADQAALLRVAELVARGAPPVEVFAAVAEELGRVVNAAGAKMLRYEKDGMATFLASWGSLEAGIPAGTRLSITGTSVTGQIFATGRPARVDDYGTATGAIAALQRSAGMRSAVGAPIVVDGGLWGALVVGTVAADPLPPHTEQRITKFADLVAVALSNLEARVALHALADEQAALRRVATVVARGEWDVTSATIVREVALLLEVDGSVLLRYEADETVTVLAAWGSPDMTDYVGQRLAFDGDNPAAQVWRTRRPARQEDFGHARGTLAELTRREGITCVVASPVIVENQLWGAVVVVSTEPEKLPADTEERIGQFTELVATAIGNMKSRLDLIESRARIVQTADLTRRRFERDLHDGIQQRLVSIALDLHGARESLPPELEGARAKLSGVAAQLADALEDLRELSRGLHPAILSEGGLEPAIRSLARRSPVPASVRLEHLPRLADPVEVAAYYVVSESLANAGKHAHAALVDITVRCHDGRLEVTVVDDGAGGADPSLGTGLTGLVDRVEALGGSISVRSPKGQGTRLIATLPITG